MSNGIGKLSSVSTTNVCKRDGYVLLNIPEDESHYVTLRSVPFRSVTLHYITLHYPNLSQAFYLGCLDGRPNIIFEEPFGFPDTFWSPKLINQ